MGAGAALPSAPASVAPPVVPEGLLATGGGEAAGEGDPAPPFPDFVPGVGAGAGDVFGAEVPPLELDENEGAPAAGALGAGAVTVTGAIGAAGAPAAVAPEDDAPDGTSVVTVLEPPPPDPPQPAAATHDPSARTNVPRTRFKSLLPFPWTTRRVSPGARGPPRATARGESLGRARRRSSAFPRESP